MPAKYRIIIESECPITVRVEEPEMEDPGDDPAPEPEEPPREEPRPEPEPEEPREEPEEEAPEEEPEQPEDPEPDPTPVPQPVPNPKAVLNLYDGAPDWAHACVALANRDFVPRGTPTRDTQINVRHAVSLDGFRLDSVATTALFPIKVHKGGSLEVRNFEMDGGSGRNYVGAVIKCDAGGPLNLLEDGRFIGCGGDVLKPTGSTVIRRVHFAPFYSYSPAAHPDYIHLRVMDGDVLIEDCFIQRSHDPRSRHQFGINNVLRVLSDKQDPPAPGTKVMLNRVVIENFGGAASQIHIQHKALFKPVMEFVDVLLNPENLFYKNSGRHVTRWVNVRDYRDGSLVPPPNVNAKTV